MEFITNLYTTHLMKKSQKQTKMIKMSHNLKNLCWIQTEVVVRRGPKRLGKRNRPVLMPS